MNIFERGTKEKVRFQLSNGVATMEDLYTLSLPRLDELGKVLRRELKATEEESFLTTRTKADETLQLKYDIVEHIAKARLAEAEAKKNAAAKAERKKYLTELLSNKLGEVDQQKSVEELRAELEALS